MHGRNPVIDNITTIQKLNQRIRDLEEANSILTQALSTAVDEMECYSVGHYIDLSNDLNKARRIVMGD